MVSYFVELTIIHLLLSLAYIFTFSKEKQYSLMRWYLVLSIPVASIVPLISFNLFPYPLYYSTSANDVNALVGYTLSPIIISAKSAISQHLIVKWIYLLITGILFLHFSYALIRIIQLFFSSKPTIIKGRKIYLTKKKGSFTFFNRIFIYENENLNADLMPILRHESAHARQFHSMDIILANLFRIFCWFLPTTWWLQKEIKRIHEYEADQIVLKKLSLSEYSKVLINYTLKSNGWGLANSFHDGLILKRIKAMKHQIQKINSWKLAATGIFQVVIIVTFSCSNILDSEIEKIGNNSPELIEVPPSIQAEIEQLIKDNPGKTYSYVELPIENKELVGSVVDKLNLLHITGNLLKFSLYDDKIACIMIEEDLEEVAKIPEADTDEIFTIVQDQPEFPGGLKAFYDYVATNMEYPSEARRMGIEGRVYVQFVVDKRGQITEVEAVKGIGAGCDQEAERVLKRAPRFTPGMQKGLAVKVRMVLPIIFKLNA
ncbi:MAG: TonB family protein [Bacteroidota bacterium]